MSFRFKIIFFGIIGFLVVAGLVLAVVLRPKPPAEEEKPANIAVPVLPALPSGGILNNNVSSEFNKLTPAELAEAQKDLAIKNLARLFAERFGSYSPAADFANFDELKTVVTQEFSKWLDNYKKQLAEKQPADFLGVSTRAVSQKIISSGENTASVAVSVQRQEYYKNEQKIYGKEMLVTVVRRGGQWLVDGAYWQ